MDRFIGLIGIALIFGIAFLFSNNRKAINYRLILSGIGLQIFIAVLVLKVPPVTRFFQFLGKGMQKIEQFAKEGANFVYGGIVTNNYKGEHVDYTSPEIFVFAFNITATIKAQERPAQCGQTDTLIVHYITSKI